VALFYAGDDDATVAAARRALESHPAADGIPPRVIALAALALGESGRGRTSAARTAALAAHAEARETGLGETWVGALVAGALGLVHESEGHLAEAERALVRSARLHEGSSSIGASWALFVLTRVRCARGRLTDATAALAEGRELLGRISDSGSIADLGTAVTAELAAAEERARAGELVEEPTGSELAVLRLLPTSLTLRQIGDDLFVSMNTVKSHTHSLYRKLGVTSRQEAVARAEALGLLGESPG
jgi:LuxR family transcriptional regulator, maltose regulon positive regulatory protein